MTRRIPALLVVLVVGVLAGPQPAFADPIRDAQWHLKYLNVAAAHEYTRGEGITVAVVDSGADPNHPDLAGSLAAHPERIAATFAADRGMMLAEAAVFALAARMPRPAAQELVAAAVKATDAGGTLGQALAERVPDLAWDDVLDPARQTGDAEALVDRLRAAIASGMA